MLGSSLDLIPTNGSVHDHFTRQRHIFRVRQYKHQTTSKSTFDLGKILYNISPGEIKCLSNNEFKIIVVRLIY